MLKTGVFLKIFALFTLIFLFPIVSLLVLKQSIQLSSEKIQLAYTISLNLALIIFIILSILIWKINLQIYFKSFSTKSILLSIAVTLLIIFLYPIFNIPVFFKNISDDVILVSTITVYSLEIYQEPFANFYIIIKTILIFPILEEIVFRGIILTKIKEKQNKYLAIIVSSLLFAIYHADPTHSIITFFAGLIYGYIYTKTGNLSIIILIHFLNNLAFLFLKDSNIDATGTNFTFYLIYPIALFFLYKVIQMFKIQDSEESRIN